MSVFQRNNVQISGTGLTTIVFVHGFGCDQNMWRYLTPTFKENFKIILFDLVGSGKSDLSAYDFKKYESLHGYSDDLLEIIREATVGAVILISHSVSAIIGLLATIKSPESFLSHVMIGPSPCYINDGDYKGGFTRSDIEDLCNTIDSNYLGWSSTMAPAIMGAPTRPELSVELTNSFCRTDPTIAKHFARVTFSSDHRKDLGKSTTPTLILQCSDDFIAPRSVGEYMQKAMPNAVLTIIDNVGHCPHLSAPDASTRAIKSFLSER